MQALSGLHYVLCGRNYAVEHVQHSPTLSHMFYIYSRLTDFKQYVFLLLTLLNGELIETFCYYFGLFVEYYEAKGEKTTHLTCERHGRNIRRD